MATPSRMSRPCSSTDGQRSKPRLLREIMCTKDGKTKTRARPQVAPENLQETLLLDHPAGGSRGVQRGGAGTTRYQLGVPGWFS